MSSEAPWEHPDWYDIHDTTWTAGPEREPEHYREMMIALPPLDREDHLVDIGAGTGKLAFLIARHYPRLGRVTLIEPNRDKLERAAGRLTEALPEGRIESVSAGLGEDAHLPQGVATIVTVGSVFMPIMGLRGGTLADGLGWLRKALADTLSVLRPGAWMYAIETLAAPWDLGSSGDPVRRLNMPELTAEVVEAGFQSVECVYRFRDRVALRARRP